MQVQDCRFRCSFQKYRVINRQWPATRIENVLQTPVRRFPGLTSAQRSGRLPGEESPAIPDGYRPDLERQGRYNA
ncbi:hypothetical protein GCM10009414_15460 [Tatumella terrea]